MKTTTPKPTISLSSIEMARQMRVRRISQIEDSLARPGLEPGPAWDERKRELERELERLLAVQRQAARKSS